MERWSEYLTGAPPQQALGPAGAACYCRRYSPRATITASPATSTLSRCSDEPWATARSTEGRPIFGALADHDLLPEPRPPVTGEMHRQRPGG